MLPGHKYQIGEKVRLKKGHPCGHNEWEILRIGMDFGIKCSGCGHYVLLPRKKFEKSVKAILTATDTEE